MRYGQWRYYAIAVLAILLYIWGAERQWKGAALPEVTSLTEASFPVEFNSHVAGNRQQLEFLVQGYPIGQTIEVHGQDVTHSLILVPAMQTFSLIFMLLNGAFFWIVSVVVFAPRINRVPARDFFWGFLLYGLAVMIGNIYFPREGLGPSAAFSLLRLAAATALPILLLNVSLTFPRRREILDKAPRLILAVFLAGFAIVTWQCVALLQYFAAPTPTHWETYSWPAMLQKLFLVIVFTAACLSFLVTNRSARRAREKQQAQWILWGITIGATPFVFLYTLPQAWGGDPILPLAITRLFSIAIPVAFSFSVIWFKFLDIDLIIRRSLIYPLLAVIMGGLYFLLGVQIGRRVQEEWPVLSAAIPVLATLIPVLLFNPTRRFLGWSVDRTFFKIRYNYNQTLANFKLKIYDVSSQQLLAEALAEFLKRALGTRKVAVILRGQDQTWLAGSQQTWIAHTALEEFAKVLSSNRAVAVPDSVSLPEIESSDFPAQYMSVGYKVAQPLHVDTLLGVAIIGEKTVQRLYIKQDLQLLASAAEATAAALERMNLVQEVVKEALARNRSEEMNRFKTEFLARVAHDLRTPLTSISWSARNLLDGVTGALTPKQAQYLTGIESSSGQMVRMVNNLLEMNRLEETQVKLASERVDLGEILRQTIEKLEPVRVSKNIEFKISGPQDAVTGDSVAFLEVVDNLLENALRYSPPDTCIEINIAKTKEHRVRLAIRDHGPGVAAEDLDLIFARYRQGRPSPYSSKHGFGLGLHVVQTYVELMGGSISVTNHPEGGALFECIMDGWSNGEAAR